MRDKTVPLKWIVPAVLAASGPAWAASVQVAGLQSLADLSLEQLSSIDVTSVSGRAESLQDAAASIFVITAQDIRRSAADSLPEVLRLAPNLQVARASAGTYAITARGTNTAIANKTPRPTTATRAIRLLMGLTWSPAAARCWRSQNEPAP